MKPIQTTSRLGLTAHHIATLSSAIQGGKLQPGDALPSVRRFAAEAHISTFTAMAVYAQLTALGLLEARPGRGYFVQSPAAPSEPTVAMDAVWEHRQVAKKAHSIVVDAGSGWLPSDWQFQSGLRSGLRSLANDTQSLEGYGTALGFEPLRLFLSERARRQGIALHADQVLLTQGASQSLDLIVRTLLDPHDEVAIEEPAYPPTLELLRERAIKLHPIPRLQTGPDVSRLKQCAEAHKLKAFFTNTSLQNPTGSTTQPNVARDLVELAHQHGFWVVEDEIFNELTPQPTQTLAHMDQCQRVLQVGSFSKTLSTSLRQGFTFGSKAVIDKLAHVKTLSVLGSSEISERLVLHMLTSTQYRQHLKKLKSKLETAHREVQSHLEEFGIEWHSRPRGGLFLFGRFKQPQATAQRWRRAMEAGVLLAPGELFRVDGRASPFWRFNVARASDSRLWELLKKL